MFTGLQPFQNAIQRYSDRTIQLIWFNHSDNRMSAKQCEKKIESWMKKNGTKTSGVNSILQVYVFKGPVYMRKRASDCCLLVKSLRSRFCTQTTRQSLSQRVRNWMHACVCVCVCCCVWECICDTLASEVGRTQTLQSKIKRVEHFPTDTNEGRNERKMPFLEFRSVGETFGTRQ